MPRLTHPAPPAALALAVALLALPMTARAQDAKPAPTTAPAAPASPAGASTASPAAAKPAASDASAKAAPLVPPPELDTFAKGDASMLIKDYDAAISAYKEVIAKAPEAPLAYYRLAEAQKLKGDLTSADQTYATALRFVGKDGTLKGKILFCLADLSERQKNSDQGIERWTAYEVFARTAEKAKVHPASAAERKKRVQDWKQLSADSAEVKVRIAKRLQEAEETARKNATTKK